MYIPMQPMLGQLANSVMKSLATLVKARVSKAKAVYPKPIYNTMSLATRTARLAREVQSFSSKPPWGITLHPEKDDNFDELKATLMGPRGSPYERGKFTLTITIPERYPFEPPLVKFTTPVYHPNIDQVGRICMDMLKMPPKGSWLPTITLETLLVSIQTLLANPNPDDPLMMDIANEYKYDIKTYLEKAKSHTESHAIGSVL